MRQRVLEENRRNEAQRQREERERQALMVRSAAEEAARRVEEEARAKEEAARRAEEEARAAIRTVALWLNETPFDLYPGDRGTIVNALYDQANQ